MADLWYSISRWFVFALISLSFVRLMIAVVGRGITVALFIGVFVFILLPPRLRGEIMTAVFSWASLLRAMIVIVLIFWLIRFIIRKIR